jgi:hypothetical protein
LGVVLLFIIVLVRRGGFFFECLLSLRLRRNSKTLETLQNPPTH